MPPFIDVDGEGATPADYVTLVNMLIYFINVLITALFAIIFLYFIWKMIDCWVINAGDETKQTEGKRYAVSAVVTFVLAISAWGIVAMIQSTLFG
jgi:hypothetical protein